MSVLRVVALAVLATLSAGPGAHASPANTEYPLRATYPSVAVLETEELGRRFNDVVIVDVRSKFEFDTLHVLNARHLPLERSFGDQVLAVAKETGKPVVLYCNGKTCHKAYDAALAAMKARVPEVYVYDPGILDWARARPDLTVLLGRSPNKASDLISQDRFMARVLDPGEFVRRAEEAEKTIVLDVRDLAQRDIALFPFQERRATLDQRALLERIVEEAQRANKTLLVYDAVGKQVQWLQYYLERKGLRSYYFMRGGAQGYYEKVLGKVAERQ